MLYGCHILGICLVVGWAGQKSVNGDPTAGLGAQKPVWYNAPISTSLVYQRSASSVGETRAFPSPVYYAPAISKSANDLPGPSSTKEDGAITTTATRTTTEAAASASPQKYDIFKFFEKLKRINEKYASVGTQKQLNEDAEEEETTSSTVASGDDDGNTDGDEGAESSERQDRAESDNNETAEAINEGRKKFHSHGLIKFKTKGKKKLSKLLYPIIVGLITAKSILIPLFFKAVVVLSKFSFFVSTLSFIISSILGIKVLLLSNNNSRRSNDNTRVEVVHVPLQQKYPTTYSSSSSAGWIDRESDGKFIPITGSEAERIIYEKPYSEQEKGLEKDSYLPL